jgi:hypothetical protein
MKTPTLLAIILFVSSVGSILPAAVVAQPVSSNLLQEKLQSACSFLKTLYNPALQLVRSTPTSNVYYIASDNLLAAKALSPCDKTTSQAINQSIRSCCNNGYDGMHEVVLGVKITLPIHTSTTVTVANSSQGKLFRNITPAAAGGDYTILWQVHNSSGVFPDCVYADTTVYTALELKLEGNNTGVQHQMDCLAVMFDGHGMVDEPYKDGTGLEHGIYETYKLALYLYALQTTSAYYFGEQDILLRSQGLDGGFHTGYDQQGTYAGTQENAETTSTAMIGMANLSSPTPFPRLPLLSIPSWIVFLFTGIAVAAVALVIAVIILDERKRKRRPGINLTGFPKSSQTVPSQTIPPLI